MVPVADEAADAADADALVIQLTREVLTEAAPEELDVFAADEHGWVAGREPPARDDELLGFGAEVVVLLTPFVVAGVKAAIQCVADALSEAAKSEARPVLVRWLRRLFHADKGTDLASKPPPLAPDMTRRVRDVTFGTCRQMGLGDDDASLIADAVVGRLAVATP